MNYDQSLRSVFIDPIRSVLAIDDEFPTLDELLNGKAESTEKGSVDAHWERLAKLLLFCRDSPRHWLVDVHNGRDEDLKELPFSSMRQSDWLILDYHLDGDMQTGSKSIAILKTLANNSHFNLVTIYTKGELQKVFEEIMIAFCRQTKPRNNLEDNAIVDDVLDGWENYDPEIKDRLKDSLSVSTYLRLKENGFGYGKKNSVYLTELAALIEGCGPEPRLIPQKLLNRLIGNLEILIGLPEPQENDLRMNHALLGGEYKWLVVGNLFVCIADKKVEDADQLVDHLLRCLVDWRPSPNRLILGKLRAELDAAGILAHDMVMSNENMQAFWLSNLLNSKPWERQHQIESLVDRQKDLLFSQIRGHVSSFADAVIANLLHDNSPDEIVGNFFKGPFSLPKGMIAHNAYLTTRPISASNLEPGHVIKIGNNGEESYWICSSPACDLVPDRSTGRDLKLRLGHCMPFVALKVFKVSERVALENATKGHVLFIDVAGVVQFFSLHDKGAIGAGLIWEEFFAKDQGKISRSNNSLVVAQLSGIRFPEKAQLDSAEILENEPDSSTRAVVGDMGDPSFKFHEAFIMAELRSEYSSNLSQRLTSHLGRVGLDYVGLDKEGCGCKV
jgi:hypothetical protein